ncbi:hypothetical protein CKF54_00760 [Psittacicella hinzii]|uniref:ABC transporter domain-containing protein n=1 Tax=Psittacicella hinzii TaxID=2028575 RepID=A0A3A1Y9M0_9GAMM|nr:ATP-binding cassette domain-containing protein [Psittacicella hinzii]RIY34375.1 hypothetical protein CKF54_00760 [Psittacicella hinzii]
MNIQLKNVSFTRANQEFHFDLEIPQGQKVAIIGESGAGKSTLVNLIAGFYPVTKGEIYLNEKLVNSLPPSKRNCALVFQENNHFPHLTIAKNVQLAFLNSKVKKNIQQEQVQTMLAQLNISEIADKLPQNCSGGQQQRAALARGLLFPRDILLLDEPLSALDQENAQRVVKILQQRQQTMLIVTHDLESILPLVDRVLTISNGKVINDQLITK